MARTKFTFEKRQRELAKKQKKEEKAARRAEAKLGKDETDQPPTGEGLDNGGDALPDEGGNAGPAEEAPR